MIHIIDFFLDLVGKVRKVKQKTSTQTPGTRRHAGGTGAQFQEVTVSVLLLVY